MKKTKTIKNVFDKSTINNVFLLTNTQIKAFSKFYSRIFLVDTVHISVQRTFHSVRGIIFLAKNFMNT